MNTYPTSYPSGAHRFGSYVRASSIGVAEKRIALRGLGERIDGTSPAQKRISAFDLYRRKKYIECIHWLCFAGNVLCNAGLWKREQLLDDSGLIHMVVHQMTTSKAHRKRYKSFVEGEHKTTLMLLELFDERTKKLGY